MVVIIFMFQEIMNMVILTVVLPVFLIFLLGFAGQKILHLQIKSISTTGLYLMTPALVFNSFYETKLDQTYLHIIIYGLLLSILLILLMKGIARVRKYGSSVTSGMILATAFMNNGNMGAPLALFAFGSKGFQYAVAIMVFHSLVMSTLGLYYAAKGSLNVKDSLLSVVKMPILHACLAGIIFQLFRIPIPENLMKVITMVGDASIPLVMLTLGMQLAEIRLHNLQWAKINIALLLRLIVSPLIALLIAWILRVDPLLAKVMILSAAMPSAAFTTMYSLQFDTEPELVSSVTFISTLMSICTLSLLLIILCR